MSNAVHSLKKMEIRTCSGIVHLILSTILDIEIMLLTMMSQTYFVYLTFEVNPYPACKIKKGNWKVEKCLHKYSSLDH